MQTPQCCWGRAELVQAAQAAGVKRFLLLA